jgi:hypothetical protein
VDSPSTSPHAEYDRWIAGRERRGSRWRRLGQIAFYVVGGILAVVLAALLTANIIDLGQPRIWGTFTQTGCEERPRYGCRPFGTWVSDDGSLHEQRVYLNGWTDDRGQTRASFQPTALIGDDVVNVPVLTGVWPWINGPLMVWWVGYVLYKAAGWGDIPLPPGRRRRDDPDRRQGALGIRGSFRRQYRQSLARGTRDEERGGA